MLSHPYEALSYVWGSEDKPRSIAVDDQEFNVTQNLYAALLLLRNHTCPRILWVDAICIDQANEEEKKSQIPLMSKIYAKATNVIVWLGEAMDDSDRALEEIRRTAEKSAKSPDPEFFEQAIRKLLRRPWFRRIWVLQEMAAARHILIICGSTAIDGHAFCAGLDILGALIDKDAAQVVFVMRGAIFRPRTTSPMQDSLLHGICSLGELIDMYHAHEATKLHDKIYALLSMCRDDLSKTSLGPDYTIEWGKLMEKLVRYLLSDHVFVKAYDDEEIAAFRCKGCILGRVSKVEVNVGLGGGQTLDIVFTDELRRLGSRNACARWTIPMSADLVKDGDVICLLERAPKPTIVRLYKDYLAVVVIAATPLEQFRTKAGDINWSDLPGLVRFTRDLLLVWEWKTISKKFQNLRRYDVSLRKTVLHSHVGKAQEDQLGDATRVWQIALVLGDLEEYKRAEENIQVGIKQYEIILGGKRKHTSASRYGLTPLCWAAGNGYGVIVDLLFQDNVDLDLKDSGYGRTPLLWAAANGHKAIVQVLLDTGKVDVNSKDRIGWTPLSHAIKNGHESIVQVLLDTGKVDVNSKDRIGWTPLRYAIKNGHESIIRLLLSTNKICIDINRETGRELFGWAIEEGHESIAASLLRKGVNVDLKNIHGLTLLSLALRNGQEAIAKLLLNHGVNVDLADNYGRTPLLWAAKDGYKTIVELILSKGVANIDSKDSYGQTPLSWAVRGGYDAIVRLLLKTKNVEIDSKNYSGRTPFSWAARNGHKAVMQLLLSTGKVDIDSKDKDNRTSLSWAAGNGHEAIVQLLLDTGKIDIDSKDKNGRTPLSWANENAHESIVKLLESHSVLPID